MNAPMAGECELRASLGGLMNDGHEHAQSNLRSKSEYFAGISPRGAKRSSYHP